MAPATPVGRFLCRRPLALSSNVGSFLELPGQLSGGADLPSATQPSGVPKGHTKPELLHGVPEAVHVGPPALEEIQLPGVSPLEDLKGGWTLPSDTLRAVGPHRRGQTPTGAALTTDGVKRQPGGRAKVGQKEEEVECDLRLRLAVLGATC